MTTPRTISVAVRLFAHAREAAGAASLQVQVAEGARADAVWAALPPEVCAVLDPATTRIAVNGEWADAASPVAEDDELALVPPVSGG